MSPRYGYGIGLGINYSNVLFSPADVVNLAAWWRSDSGITKDGSDRVSDWKDKSDNEIDLAQSIGADQPLYVVNTFNGHAIIRFDGLSEYLIKIITNLWTTVETGTVFIVSSHGDISRLLYSADAVTNNYYIGFESRGVDNNNSLGILSRLAGADDLVYGDDDVNDNNAHYLTYESDGSDYFLRRDGVDQTVNENTGDDNSGRWFGDIINRDNIAVGCITRLNKIFNFGNDIAEIIIYSGRTSTANRTLIENYLSKRYDI